MGEGFDVELGASDAITGDVAVEGAGAGRVDRPGGRALDDDLVAGQGDGVNFGPVDE